MQIYAELLMSLPPSTLTQTEKSALATGKMMTMRVTLKYEATLPSFSELCVSELKLGPAMIGFFSALLSGRGWAGSVGRNQPSASVNCADKNS